MNKDNKKNSYITQDTVENRIEFEKMVVNNIKKFDDTGCKVTRCMDEVIITYPKRNVEK